MFSQAERLTRAEFDAVFQTGARTHFPHLTVITAKNPTTKVAVVVGKKVALRAVRRNVLRRRIYEVLRTTLIDAHYTGSIIVLVKPSFNTLPRRAANEFVKTSIAQVLKSA